MGDHCVALIDKPRNNGGLLSQFSLVRGEPRCLDTSEHQLETMHLCTCHLGHRIILQLESNFEAKLLDLAAVGDR